MTTEVEDFLAHYGVKGMRWGHRKDSKGSVSQALSVGDGQAVVVKYNKRDVTIEATPNGINLIGSRKAVDDVKSQLANNPRVSEEHAKASEYAKRPASQLSNDQLKVLTSRLELERKYSSLVPKEVSRGKKAVDNIMTAADTANKVVAFVNSPAGKAAREAIKKAKVRA